MYRATFFTFSRKISKQNSKKIKVHTPQLFFVVFVTCNKYMKRKKEATSTSLHTFDETHTGKQTRNSMPNLFSSFFLYAAIAYWLCETSMSNTFIDSHSMMKNPRISYIGESSLKWMNIVFWRFWSYSLLSRHLTVSFPLILASQCITHLHVLRFLSLRHDMTHFSYSLYI